jgi:dTDP-4-amino-4,6-dideoxygalactose transaminase
LLLDERFSQTPESPEWHVAPTAAERRLISLVLRHAEADCSRREVLVARYLERLRRIPGVRCPVGATGALSHFSIGIPEEIRPGLRERLRASGVDAGLLFPYPSYLPRSAFPNARRAGSEVINLPVHHRVTPTLVDEICAEVSAGR